MSLTQETRTPLRAFGRHCGIRGAVQSRAREDFADAHMAGIHRRSWHERGGAVVSLLGSQPKGPWTETSAILWPSSS